MPKNKPLRETLGANVKGIMRTKKLSQPTVAKAAKKAGTPINQTTVSRVANAVYPATIDTLEAVANGLDVHPWMLLVPAGTDERLLGVLRAWSESNETGRRLLALAARGAREQGTESEENGSHASVANPRRTRGD